MIWFINASAEFVFPSLQSEQVGFTFTISVFIVRYLILCTFHTSHKHVQAKIKIYMVRIQSYPAN